MRRAAAVTSVVLVCLSALPAAAYTPPWPVERVSVARDGRERAGDSGSATISADGWTVAFRTTAALVPDDRNGITDVYVRDLRSGVLERVSVSSTGREQDSETATPKTPPSLSADGSIVAFESGASHLVDGDSNGVDDVFVHFRHTGATIRVSTRGDGTQASDHSSSPVVSGDGRWVFFLSEDDTLVDDDVSPYIDVFRRDLATGALDLVSRDSQGRQSVFDPLALDVSHDGSVVTWDSRGPTYDAPDVNGIYGDVFVRDLDTGTTERVSDGAAGLQGDDHASSPSISADGRYVAFASSASNLVPDDGNGAGDVFVHDRLSGRTERVSAGSDGTEGGAVAGSPVISGDGRVVAFNYVGSELDDVEDTNTGTDVVVHDRLTGATTVASTDAGGTTGDGVSTGPDLSADGSVLAFSSASSRLVADDGNGDRDVFVRLLGRPLDAFAQPLPGGGVQGWARFAGTAVGADDSPSDATVQGRAGGGEIVTARAVWRPEEEDVAFVLDLADLPSAGDLVGAPGLRYAVSFKLDGVRHEVRLQVDGSSRPAPQLLRCDGACERLAAADGSLGVTGERLVVSFPVSRLPGAAGATLTGVTATTSFTGTVTTSGDSVGLPDLTLGVPRVELAAGTPAEPPGDGAFVAVEPDRGHFSSAAGTSGDGVWSRACLGADCSPARFVASP